MAYQIIYSLAARGGRQEALFGSCAPLAAEAFERSCACDAFPELWFELPLAGEPWFDLHALTSRDDVRPGMIFRPERTGGWPEVFEWFAGAENVRQLALSFDVSSGSIERPAVQLLVSRRDARTTCDFLEAAGRPDAVAPYRSFLERLPEGWFACYTGTFPARAGEAPASGGPASGGPALPWVRVECIPTAELQRAYASDAALLEAHLRQTGLAELGDTLMERFQALAGMPFQLEFQFDVMGDGRAGRTIGVSSRFAMHATDEWHAFDSPAAIALMRRLEGWGLADSRWQLLGQTAFSKRLDFNGESCLIYCLPTFVKLRWRGGEPLDAKTYLIAGLQ